LAPILESSEIFVCPQRPWGEAEQEIIDCGRQISVISIKDIIITEELIQKLRDLKIDYPLKKLILQNIFGTKTAGCINKVLGNLSQSFKLIENIDISGNALGPSISFIVGLLETSTAINISNCGLNIDDFNGVAFQFSKNLKSLSCSRNSLEGYPRLEIFFKIEEIDFSSCRIPKDELNKLIAVITQLPSIRKLNLSDNGFSVKDDVLDNLTIKLATWINIEELCLGDIGLTTSQSRKILDTLKSGEYRKLSKIDLSFSKLRKIDDLGSYFLSLPKLKFLNLTGNNLKERVTQIRLQLDNCKVIEEEDEEY